MRTLFEVVCFGCFTALLAFKNDLIIETDKAIRCLDLHLLFYALLID